MVTARQLWEAVRFVRTFQEAPTNIHGIVGTVPSVLDTIRMMPLSLSLNECFARSIDWPRRNPFDSHNEHMETEAFAMTLIPELIWEARGHGKSNKLIVTPTHSHPRSIGVTQGGAAFKGYYVAVNSEWETLSKLISLCTLCNKTRGKLLHHHTRVRIRYQETLRSILRSELRHYDHYQPLTKEWNYFSRQKESWEAEDRPHPYLNRFVDTESFYLREMMWDFVCEEPKAFMDFLAQGFGFPYQTAEPDGTDAFGMIRMQDRDGSIWGASVRQSWWDVRMSVKP